MGRATISELAVHKSAAHCRPGTLRSSPLRARVTLSSGVIPPPSSIAPLSRGWSPSLPSPGVRFDAPGATTLRGRVSILRRAPSSSIPRALDLYREAQDDSSSYTRWLSRLLDRFIRWDESEIDGKSFSFFSYYI